MGGIHLQSRRIKLTIEYDGSYFHGWQMQENAHSVQEELEKAILRLTGENSRVTGASRTDTGVHALGQVAHFDTHSRVPADKFVQALNSFLPPQVAIVLSEEAAPDFHSRFSATGKIYEYKVLNRKNRSPLLANRTWHVREDLDITAMNQAAQGFIGKHDFSAFCASGHSVRTFGRIIYSSEWKREGDILIYRVSGNGFLYHMVRIMTGTMVEIGKKKRPAEEIEALIAGRDRNLAGITAPPDGLYLVKVLYPEEVSDND